MQGRGLRLPFECISRAERIDEDVADALASLGCFRLWIGSESGSQGILDAMDRRVKVDEVRAATGLLKKRGIQVGMFIMLGYEGEEGPDLAATVDHLKKADPDVFLTTVSYPIKGTPYYDDVAAPPAGPLRGQHDWDQDPGLPHALSTASRGVDGRESRATGLEEGATAPPGATSRHGAAGHGPRRVPEGPVIVLVNPWSTPSAKKPRPMSLLALAGVLEGRYEYAIVDGNLENAPVARIAEIARRKRLTAIGVTVMPGPQLNEAVPETRALKAALPDVPIVWGGYFPSLHDETCLLDPAVDFVVRSQGEATLLELLQVLERGGDLGSVLSLSWRHEGSFRRNPPRPLIPLDDLPDWPYDRVPMERHIHSHYLGRRVGTHHSSYGCPFGCNFCAVVPMSNRRWLAQSPERIEGILRLLQGRYGIDAVQFTTWTSSSRSAHGGLRRAHRAWPGVVGPGRVDELMKFGDARGEDGEQRR
jgi:radical SAM superfamily enzyme YgiQ (UPF0313 family)